MKLSKPSLEKKPIRKSKSPEKQKIDVVNKQKLFISNSPLKEHNK